MWATLAIMAGGAVSSLATPLTPDDLEHAPVDVSTVQRLIDDILSDPRYGEERRTLLERILGPLYDWLERMVAFVSDLVTRAFLQVVSLLDLEILSWAGPVLVAIAAVAAGLFLGRRRARDIERRATVQRILSLGTDPRRLEDLSDQAIIDGEYAESIRLRFVAGLLRLDEAGRLDFYPGLSNAVISTELANPTFDRLGNQFDRVVYGRRPASVEDATAAHTDWATLLGVRT